MKDKPGDKTDKQVEGSNSPVDAGVNAGIVVEEQVLERNQYDSTTSFEMDIEKAKAMATSQPGSADARSDASSMAQVNTAISDEEKERIKQSLAELRELEQEQSDDEYGHRSGLFGKIKACFLTSSHSF